MQGEPRALVGCARVNGTERADPKEWVGLPSALFILPKRSKCIFLSKKGQIAKRKGGAAKVARLHLGASSTAEHVIEPGAERLGRSRQHLLSRSRASDCNVCHDASIQSGGLHRAPRNFFLTASSLSETPMKRARRFSFCLSLIFPLFSF